MEDSPEKPGESSMPIAKSFWEEFEEPFFQKGFLNTNLYNQKPI